MISSGLDVIIALEILLIKIKINLKKYFYYHPLLVTEIAPDSASTRIDVAASITSDKISRSFSFSFEISDYII